MSQNHVYRIPRLYRLPLFPLRAFSWLWMKTVRFEISPESLAALKDTSEPTILLFWHNRLLATSEIFQKYRSNSHAYGLISASKDGAWLEAFCRLFGVRAVRGSSSRRGSAALREMLARIESGSDAVITPDGPRGPRYSFKPGAAALVQQSKARVLLIGTRSSRTWHLKSWDRFIIPIPFSKTKLECRLIQAEDLPRNTAECVEMLRTILLEINDD